MILPSMILSSSPYFCLRPNEAGRIIEGKIMGMGLLAGAADICCGCSCGKRFLRADPSFDFEPESSPEKTNDNARKIPFTLRDFV